MLAALRTRGERAAKEFARMQTAAGTAESGPVVRLTRVNMDTVSTSCHADRGQLHQKASRLYHPRSYARLHTEGHTLM